MIRTGYGRGGENQIDSKFYANIKGAQAAGIATGVYHYSYAESVADAKVEAAFCLEIIRGYKLNYPVVFDIEDDSITRLDRRTKTDICRAFCDEIRKAGYYAMFYTNVNWLTNHLYADELLENYDLWLAQWGVDEPAYPCGIWQYSDSGSVDGISGNVDTNISYKDYPSIVPGAPAESTPSTPPPATTTVSYTVQAGDTLSEIAVRYNTSYSEIARINGISNPDLIYAGQVLKIPAANQNPSEILYTVQAGDTLSGIAAKYNTTYTELARLNGIANPDLIYAGQVIRVPN